MKFLGLDTSGYTQKRPKSEDDLKGVCAGMVCSLRDLFASMPEIADLFAEVFGGPPRWVSVANDLLGSVYKRPNLRFCQWSPKG